MSDQAMIEPLLKKKPIEKAVDVQTEDHIDILGVHVSLKGRHGLLNVVQNAIRSNEKRYVSYANIHTLNLAQEQSSLGAKNARMGTLACPTCLCVTYVLH